MNWLYYLLEANLYLILFYWFYRVFLQKETFYALNRYYLISISVVAFLIPIFQLGFLKKTEVLVFDYSPNIEIEAIPDQISPINHSVAESLLNLSDTILIIYCFVALLFLSKFLFSISKILKMRRATFEILENGTKLFHVRESKMAFSFFNLVFLDPELSEKNTIIKHELAHIKQKHSIDVILFELLQIINWFNPVTFFIKQDIKLLHEYLADDETTKNDIEKYDYAMFLIKNSSAIQDLTLTNPIFSSSILKKRISMLNQKKSARWARLKLLLFIPIISGTICISTMAFTKDYAIFVLNPTEKVLSRKVHQEIPSVKEKTKLAAPVLKKNNSLIKKKKQNTIKKTEQTEKLPQTYFYARNTYYEGKAVKTDPRFIIINGKGTEDNKLFVGVQNTESVKLLSQSDAVKKYGEKGKNGAVEIAGDNVKTIDKFPTPPPFPKLTLDRAKSELLIIPDSDNESKTLTIYNKYGKVVYNTSDYKNNWNGSRGNYGNFLSELPEDTYQYFMKISGEPLKNKRGAITIKD